MPMEPVHLAVLIHGLYGSKSNLVQAELALRAADAALPQDSGRASLDILVAQGIAGSLTYDGIDFQARQVAKEVDARVDTLYDRGKEVVSISIMGYSLGGLVARFLVGLLDSRTPSFFERIRPSSFSTIATPHIGIPRYGSKMSRIQHAVGGQLFSVSGQQLFCLDRYGPDGRCLLHVMADPSQRFIRALRKFPAIQIVANGCHDRTVPYPTASFSEFDPFVDFETSGLELELDEDQVVTSWTLPRMGTTTPTELTSGPDEQVPLLESRIGNVTQARKGRRRPRLPPVLSNFRFPFNYIAMSLLPILVPLFLIYAFTTLAIHSFQSYRRLATLLTPDEKATLMLHEPAGAEIDTAPAVWTANDPLTSATGIEDFTEDDPRLKNLGLSGSNTPSVANVVPLLLSTAQVAMIRNLNAALPHAHKVVAWFPFAYNSHAMIVLRDPINFPAQEEARGVLRRWARFVAESMRA